MADTKPVYHGTDLEGMSFAPKYQQWILDSISNHLGLRVAEVGAGRGNFTRLLIADNTRQVFSFEPSENMFPLLNSLTSGNDNLITYNSFLGAKTDGLEGFFDTVLYINVLEHIEDDQVELANAHKVLAENGKLIIFVPALNFLYSNFDKMIGHHRRYHKESLVNLVSGSGYRIEKITYFDIVGIIPWYLVFVLLKSEKIPGSVVVYDNLVVPLMKRLENLATPPIGKNLLLIASKL